MSAITVTLVMGCWIFSGLLVARIFRRSGEDKQ